MREVYLFGVNHHNYQFPDSKFIAHASQEERDKFRHSLVTAISHYGIRGIAEEMSEEALEKRSISGGSMLYRFAFKMCLPYHLCDLDPHAPNDQRRLIWSSELNGFNTFPVLFVLGADHVDSFERLLSKSGFQPVIIVRDWKAFSDRNEAI